MENVGSQLHPSLKGSLNKCLYCTRYVYKITKFYIFNLKISGPCCFVDTFHSYIFVSVTFSLYKTALESFF